MDRFHALVFAAVLGFVVLVGASGAPQTAAAEDGDKAAACCKAHKAGHGDHAKASCCAEGASCCKEGASCCASAATATAEKGACCAEGAACCKDGAACCAAKADKAGATCCAKKADKPAV
jgi:hypothetical protein